MQRGLQSRNGANDSEQDRLHPARHLPQGRYFACWAPSVAEWDERHQEIVLKNDPGCARQGVEVERNREQTRIALTNDVDRAQRGVFKGFSFFLALWVIFLVGARLFRARFSVGMSSRSPGFTEIPFLPRLVRSSRPPVKARVLLAYGVR